MRGAIIGDIVGSVHEAAGTKSRDFPLFEAYSTFTDDTVLTIAVADALMNQADLTETLQSWFRRYPDAGYGGSFMQWALHGERTPYNSWGNGSAMRVSSTAYIGQSLDEVLELARRTAQVTHNHPEGIKGAQATAAAIYLARSGSDKNEIQQLIETRFGYDLSTPLEEIRPAYIFDVSCQGSVPPSIRAFLEAHDFEDTLRNAISLGGDADTMACIAGSIAEPFFGIPEEIETEALPYLDNRLRKVLETFRQQWKAGR